MAVAVAVADAVVVVVVLAVVFGVDAAMSIWLVWRLWFGLRVCRLNRHGKGLGAPTRERRLTTMGSW